MTTEEMRALLAGVDMTESQRRGFLAVFELESNGDPFDGAARAAAIIDGDPIARALVDKLEGWN